MAQSIRRSPYTIPAPRANSSSTTYNPQYFSSETASVPVAGTQTSATYSIPPRLSSPSNTGPPSPSDGFSHVNNQLRISYLSDSSCSAGSDDSPCSSESPNSPPDLTVEEASLFADPYNTQCCQAGYYSSAPFHLNKYSSSGSMANGDLIAPPQQAFLQPMAAYPSPITPSSMLQSPGMPYYSHDYYFPDFFNTRFMPPKFTSAAPSCFSNSSPSFTSHMPQSLNTHMWSSYPSLPSINPLPSTKLSYDSPRYKLTPERAIPLIKWFEEHKEHPYPTRHEKILLCQSTQLTFTQVSTWFANARRRMKKATSSEEEDSNNSSNSGSGSERENSPDYCS